jgi:hypothetical protein
MFFPPNNELVSLETGLDDQEALVFLQEVQPRPVRAKTFDADGERPSANNVNQEEPMMKKVWPHVEHDDVMTLARQADWTSLADYIED